MRVLAVALTGAALLPACLGPRSQPCADGIWCPADYACVGAPTYCALAEDVVACGGVDQDGMACSTDTAPHGYCAGGACAPCSVDQIACAYPDWVAMTSPVSTNLTGVFALGPTEAYAVGEGKVLRYDGAAWAPFAAPAPSSAGGIWAGRNASDQTELFVTTISEVHRFDGTWAQAALPAAYSLVKSIWGTSPTDLYVGAQVGQTSALLHFDGGSWSASGTTALVNGVGSRSVGDVVAVLFDGSILELAANGQTWAPANWTPPTNSSLVGVWVGQEGAAFAIGDQPGDQPGDPKQPLLVTRATTPGAWQLMPLPSGTLGALFGVSGSGRDRAVAGGEGGTLLHLEGGAWSVVSPPAATKINAISATASGDVFAVGDGGAIWRYRRSE